MPTNTIDLIIVQRWVGQSTEVFGHENWYTVHTGGQRLNVPATLVKSLYKRKLEVYSVTFWDGGPATIFFALDFSLGGRQLKVRQVLARSEDEKQRFLSLGDEAQFQLFGF